ncbi:MAG: phosphomannose isomerase type II C-terminal cupin domain [Dermatophilaceae bacterium]
MSSLQDPRGAMFTESRPWGQFEQFVANTPVTVKIISVDPGHRLSLQSHSGRGEFWQVLDEPMDIHVDGIEWTAVAGEQIWIPAGATHRMGNSGARPARILEIALGLFDEEDIVRIEDDYARDKDARAAAAG